MYVTHTFSITNTGSYKSRHNYHLNINTVLEQHTMRYVFASHISNRLQSFFQLARVITHFLAHQFSIHSITTMASQGYRPIIIGRGKIQQDRIDSGLADGLCATDRKRKLQQQQHFKDQQGRMDFLRACKDMDTDIMIHESTTNQPPTTHSDDEVTAQDVFDHITEGNGMSVAQLLKLSRMIKTEIMRRMDADL